MKYAIFVDEESLFAAARKRVRFDLLLDTLAADAESRSNGNETCTLVEARVYLLKRAPAQGLVMTLSELGYSVFDYLRRGQNDSFSWAVRIALDVIAEEHLDTDICYVVGGGGNLAWLAQDLENSERTNLVVVGVPGAISGRWKALGVHDTVHLTPDCFMGGWR